MGGVIGIGFGYAMTHMMTFIDPNVRSKRLCLAVLRCAEEAQQGAGGPGQQV